MSFRPLGALSAVALLATALAAHADVDQTFYLQNFNFADGGYATGTFTPDKSGGTISGTDITITDPNLSQSPFVTTDANISSQFQVGPYNLGIFTGDDSGIGLSLSFVGPAANTIDYLTDESYFLYDNWDVSVAILAGAAISPFPAPEPATLPILAAAFGALLLGRLWLHRWHAG